jgi:hypothetical protein
MTTKEKDMPTDTAISLLEEVLADEPLMAFMGRDFRARARKVIEAASAGAEERRQVNRDELGAPVRYEIETDEGWLIRFIGAEANAHVAAIDTACVIAGDRVAWPKALPLVSRVATPSESAPAEEPKRPSMAENRTVRPQNDPRQRFEDNLSFGDPDEI